MDYKNKAIAHPDSRSVSDAKQRCLVKCFALFGLGIYIYRGDSLPEEVVEEVAEKAAPPKKAAKQKAAKKKSAPKEDAGAIKVALTAKCQELYASGWVPEAPLAKDIKAACADLDGEKMKDLLTMLDTTVPVLQQFNDDTLQGEVL